LPRLVHDRGEMLNSILLLRKLQRAGAKIIYGHDPAFWATLPQAPECVV
jgi:N-acyl homoserine lactone hydrolase